MKKNFRLLLVLFATLAIFSYGLVLSDGVWAEQPKEIVIHHIGDITGP